MTVFPTFSDKARIWVYQSSRLLTEPERKDMEDMAKTFAQRWVSHGTQLEADATFLSPFHLALAVEGNMEASGCSIDSSVRFIKELGNQFQIDFFNRMKVAVMDEEGNWRIVPYADLSEQKSLQLWDPRITSLGDFRSKGWVHPTSLF